MGKFELTILGSNSAIPGYGRWPTSQVLTTDRKAILIDAGEGCQIRMQQYKVKKNLIDTILISHLHGDHIFGLPGLLGSFALQSRKLPVKIFGPTGIKRYIETVLELSASHLSYALEIIELDHHLNKIIDSNNYVEISAFPVNHRISTYGYLIKEVKKEKNINKQAISKYQLTINEIIRAKKGEDIERIDLLITNDMVTLPSVKPRTYAYCADTLIDGWSHHHLKGVHTIYVESTYLHQLESLAKERMHATAKQAGKLANQLGVKQLIIGHYSSRYREIGPLLEEAQQEFPNTFAGYDGFILNI